MSEQKTQKNYKKPELIIYGTVAQITMTGNPGTRVDDNPGAAGPKSQLSNMN